MTEREQENLSTQLKRPIWIFRHPPEFGMDSDAHRGIRGGGAAAGRAYGALGGAPPTTAGTREITNDRRYP